MDKQTKTLLMIGGGLAVLYLFKNRPTQNNYSGNGVDTNQGDYASDGGVGGAPNERMGDMGGSGYVASGDDDTVSISNDPSTTFTGNTVTTQGDTAPVTGAVSSGLSGKPVVGKPSSVTKLPAGGKKLMPPPRRNYR